MRALLVLLTCCRVGGSSTTPSEMTTPDPVVQKPERGTCIFEIAGGDVFSDGGMPHATMVRASWHDQAGGDSFFLFTGDFAVMTSTFEGKPTVGAAPTKVVSTIPGSQYTSVSGGLVFDALDGQNATMHMQDALMRPSYCVQKHMDCGTPLSECGASFQCGSCADGQTCGGGGTAYVCGAGSCTPTTCTLAGKNCGEIADGCSKPLNCGTCADANETCGGGGVANVCGAPSCVPTTCFFSQKDCGEMLNGCGGVLPSCGTCNTAAGKSCGGGGVANVCGSGTCAPSTCAQQGKNCGKISDGCGSVLDCGVCGEGSTCGGSGTANVCSSASAKQCLPKGGTFILKMSECDVTVDGL